MCELAGKNRSMSPQPRHGTPAVLLRSVGTAVRGGGLGGVWLFRSPQSTGRVWVRHAREPWKKNDIPPPQMSTSSA